MKLWVTSAIVTHVRERTNYATVFRVAVNFAADLGRDVERVRAAHARRAEELRAALPVILRHQRAASDVLRSISRIFETMNSSRMA